MSGITTGKSGLIWTGPVYDPSGYADEGRGLLGALDAAGVPTALRPISRVVAGFRDGLPARERAMLDRMAARALPEEQYLVQHHTADGFIETAPSVYRIGRTMFETDSLPGSWVPYCNGMDELWLPSQFNIETFRSAGVRVPITLIPGGIDSTFFSPSVEPMTVPGLRGTVFLSVFEWRLRKGWDLLLRAWAEAFAPDDDVTLVLRSYPIEKVSGEDNAEVINRNIDGFLADELGCSRGDVAPIVVLGLTVPAAQMPSLYRIASALVSPTRGEGWGRPFMESMACGVPVIATRWSAHLEFMNDQNSLLVDLEGLTEADGVEIPLYRNQQWAAPSVSHLVAQLQRVKREPTLMAELGARARADMVQEWPWSRAGAAMKERLEHLFAQRPLFAGRDAPDGAERSNAANNSAATNSAEHSGAQPLPVLPSICISAACFDDSAEQLSEGRLIAALSQRWPGALRVADRTVRAARPSVGSELFPAWKAVAGDTRDACTTQISWLASRAPNGVHRPRCERWIIHTGDMVGATVPGEWVRILRDQADELWVPTAMAHQACLNAGVAADRLWCVPPIAVETGVHSTGPGFPLNAGSDTIFLLPATDLDAQGHVEAILRLWQRAFGRTAACRLLVYAPAGRGRELDDWHQQLLALLGSGRLLLGAPILLVREELSHDLLIALCRTIHVVVDPTTSPRNHAIRRLAHAFGRALLTGGSTSATSEEACIRVDNSPDNPFPTARWQTALRDAAHALKESHNILLPPLTSKRDRTAEQIADEMVSRLLRPATSLRSTPLIDATAAPFALAESRAVCVLAHVDWANGTAAGVVRSYAAAFGHDDDVSLVLCLDPAQDMSIEAVARIVADAVDAAGHDATSAPDIILVTDQLSDAVRASLLARCDAVIALDDPVLEEAAIARGKAVLRALGRAAWRALLSTDRVLQAL